MTDCEFCGRAADEHTDKYGRHVACIEQIGATMEMNVRMGVES